MNAYLDNCSDAIKGLSKFLLTTRFSHAVTHPGITWYELYLLAVAHTSQPIDVISSSNAASAKTIAMQIRTFARGTSAFVRFLLTLEHLCLFRASTLAYNRMQVYGFDNKPQHICLAPVLHADIVSALDASMLSITHQLSVAQKRALDNSNLQVKVHTFKGAGTFRCLPQLQTLSGCV